MIAIEMNYKKSEPPFNIIISYNCKLKKRSSHVFQISLSCFCFAFFLGCDSSNDDTNSSVGYTEKTAEAEVLFVAVSDNAVISDSLKEQNDNLDIADEIEEHIFGDKSIECSNGGTVSYENWEANWTAISLSIDLIINECSWSNEVTDGQIRYSIEIDKESNQTLYTQTFLDTLSIEHNETSLLIDEDSQFRLFLYADGSGTYEFNNTYTFTTSISDATISATATELVHSYTLSDSTLSTYPKSGSLSINDTYNYFVYEGYDASQTPFIYQDGVLQSGESWYEGEEGDLFRFVVSEAGVVEIYYDPDGEEGVKPFINLTSLLQN